MGSLMVRLLGVLSLACMLAVATGARAATAAAETLGIDLTAPQPQVDRLGRYEQGRPIDVRVTTRSSGGVALVGVSPSGVNLRLPLVRDRGDSYGGTFTPGTPGTWSLAVASDAAGTANATSTFPLVVTEPGASDAATAAMFALALASIGGGIGLITVGRKNATQPHAS